MGRFGIHITPKFGVSLSGCKTTHKPGAAFAKDLKEDKNETLQCTGLHHGYHKAWTS
jgi:hypothetical protein